MGWFRSNFTSSFLPLFVCFCCPVLLTFFFVLQPAVLRKRAARNYITYSALMKQASLKLYADNAVTAAECLTLTDSYALMSGCVETPDLFVLIKDRERMLIIPKRCLPPEREEEITSFLRLVFARRRRVMKNWVF